MFPLCLNVLSCFTSLPIIGVLVDIGLLGRSIIKEGMGNKWRLLLNVLLKQQIITSRALQCVVLF